MALASACAAVLADSAALKATVEELLLPLELILKLRDLSLLSFHQLLEAAFKLLFELGLLFLGTCFPLFFLLFEVVNLLLQHLNVQLQLLLNFDMVANLRFVVLQLLLVLLGRQVEGVEGAGELTCCPIVDIEATWSMLVLARARILLLLKSELHEIFELGLDVGEDGQTRQVAQSRALISQFLWLNHVDLSHTNITHNHHGTSQA